MARQQRPEIYKIIFIRKAQFLDHYLFSVSSTFESWWSEIGERPWEQNDLDRPNRVQGPISDLNRQLDYY